MAKLMQPFNPANHNPDAVGGDGTLPVGTHKVIAFASEVKPTKNNNGGFLKYSLRVIEGAAAGATGADRFNLYNQNETAVRIAHDALAQMVQAIGHQGQFDDSDILLNRPFMIEVVPQPGTDYTEVKRRFPCSQANAQPQQQGGFGGGQQPQQPAQQQQAGQQWGGAAPAQQQQQQPEPQNNQQQWGGANPNQAPQNTPFGSPGAQFQQQEQPSGQNPAAGGFGGGAGWGSQQ